MATTRHTERSEVSTNGKKRLNLKRGFFALTLSRLIMTNINAFLKRAFAKIINLGLNFPQNHAAFKVWRGGELVKKGEI